MSNPPVSLNAVTEKSNKVLDVPCKKFCCLRKKKI